MPATIETATEREYEFPQRKLWTRDEYECLFDKGILDGNYELIEGEILSKMGYNPPHGVTVMAVTRWLMRVFGMDYVLCQLPVGLSNADNLRNKPQPDAAALSQPMDSFHQRHPGAEDVLLLVEVSDSTLYEDTTRKAVLYARAGFADYWVMDVNARQIRVHRDPTANGYGIVTIYAEHQEATPLSRPDARIRVADLFPPLPNSDTTE